MPNTIRNRRLGKPPRARNGLLNNLIAYWPGNEESGNALDLHVNSLTLSASNAPTSGDGLVYPLARLYARASLQYHARASEALLQTGPGTNFTLALWFRMNTKPAPGAGLVGKFGEAGAREFVLWYATAADAIRFTVGDDSTNIDAVKKPSISQWHMAVAWFDGTASYVQVDDTEVASVAAVPGLTNTQFEVARWTYGPFLTFDGLIGPTMFWKSAPGAGGVLTPAQRTALYNAGAGLRYDQFTR